MTIKDKLKIKALESKILLNQLLGKMGLLSSGSRTYGSLNEIFSFIGNSQICIQLYKEDATKKEFLFSILELLKKYGIAVSLIELEKVFSTDDLNHINEISPATVICFQYIYPNVYGGRNIDNEMEVSKYLALHSKIGFLKDIACANFDKIEEQIIFGAAQLSGYVSYNSDPKTYSEFMEASTLSACLEKRKSNCAGIALAFERYLTELNVDNTLAIGYDETDNKNGNKLINFNHVWNRLRMHTDWYNVDITNLLPHSEDTSHLEKRVSTFLLSSDQTIERVGIYLSNNDGVTPATNDYPGVFEIYNKMKTIKNVLEQFDSGDRSLTLRYNTSSDSPTGPTNINRTISTKIVPEKPYER